MDGQQQDFAWDIPVGDVLGDQEPGRVVDGRQLLVGPSAAQVGAKSVDLRGRCRLHVRRRS